MASSLTGFHMAKGDALFLEGTGLMAMCALVIVSVLVGWAIGGSGFKDGFYGNAALGLAGAGFVAGAIVDYFAQKLRHEKK